MEIVFQSMMELKLFKNYYREIDLEVNKKVREELASTSSETKKKNCKKIKS